MADSHGVAPVTPRLARVCSSEPESLTRGVDREVRHQLAMISGLAVRAVLAAARSFTAIAECADDCPGAGGPSR